MLIYQGFADFVEPWGYRNLAQFGVVFERNGVKNGVRFRAVWAQVKQENGFTGIGIQSTEQDYLTEKSAAYSQE